MRLTVELPASVHRDLLAYGEALGRESGSGAIEPSMLVGPMLARFIASAREFRRTRRLALVNKS